MIKHRILSRTLWQSMFALVAMCFTQSALAHVKWFSTNFKSSDPPAPIGEVITQPAFIYIFLLSIVCVYFFFWVDRYCWKNKVLYDFDESLKKYDRFGLLVMRGGAFIFFVTLGVLYNEPNFYLTPELKTDASWVMWFHIFIGLCAVWHRTTPITGFGILLLYAFAVHDYGIYHLLDYYIFIGIGYFLLVSDMESKNWRKSGFIVMFAGVGLSLIWASVEKFAYPHWCDPLFAKDPALLMGIDPTLYMILAGYVEFNVTFILLGAASMVGRIVAIVLETVFLLAVWRFGFIDAVGHLMIMCVVVVLIVRGPTDAREMLVLRDKSLWTEAYFMTGLYTFAFVMIFTAYYGLHYLYYGT